LSDDEEGEKNDPITLSNVRAARSRLHQDDILGKVKKILDCMRDQCLPLPLFLDALSWGDSRCTSDKACVYARTSLMVSDELPGILQRWHKPPIISGARPAGARVALEKFALQAVCNGIDRGIKLSAPLFLSPPEELSEEHLVSFDFESFKSKVKTGNQLLWEVIRHAAYSAQQETRNKHKDPDMVSKIAEFSIAY
jgi:hypothetical protein